jgi:hypothetical protein
MALPLIKDSDSNFQLMQTQWKAQLDPVLAKPLSRSNILANVALVNGVNVINHLLGRVQQGWIVSDITAAAMIYRSQPFNNKTLTLTSNAACTVNLVVF